MAAPDGGQTLWGLTLRGLTPSVGIVDESFEQGSRQIVLIQDAHTNLSAQKNIAKIIESSKAKTVFLEGGSGNDSISFLRKYGTPAERLRVAEQYLRKGYIQGPDYLDLTTDKPLRLRGVEDRKLYRESLETYRQLKNKREVFTNYLDKVDRTVETLKPKLLNPSLAALDEQKTQFDKNILPALKYFQYLEAQALLRNIPLDLFPNIRAVLKLKIDEAKIDFKKAGEEAQLPAHELRTNYEAYLRYVQSAHKIDARLTLEEKDALETLLFSSLTENDDEKRFLSVKTSLKTLRHLFELRLSSAEYRDLERHPANYDVARLTGYLNTRIMELRSNYESAVFLEPGYDEAFAAAKRFYALTYERDRVFLDKIKKQMNASGEKSAVLVAGGYHAEHLKELFKQNRISFVSVVPRVEQETNIERYEKLLLGPQTTDRRQQAGADMLSVLPGHEFVADGQRVVRGMAGAMRGARLAQSAQPKVKIRIQKEKNPIVYDPEAAGRVVTLMRKINPDYPYRNVREALDDMPRFILRSPTPMSFDRWIEAMRLSNERAEDLASLIFDPSLDEKSVDKLITILLYLQFNFVEKGRVYDLNDDATGRLSNVINKFIKNRNRTYDVLDRVISSTTGHLLGSQDTAIKLRMMHVQRRLYESHAEQSGFHMAFTRLMMEKLIRENDDPKLLDTLVPWLVFDPIDPKTGYYGSFISKEFMNLLNMELLAGRFEQFVKERRDPKLVSISLGVLALMSVWRSHFNAVQSGRGAISKNIKSLKNPPYTKERYEALTSDFVLEPPADTEPVLTDWTAGSSEAIRRKMPTLAAILSSRQRTMRFMTLLTSLRLAIPPDANWTGRSGSPLAWAIRTGVHFRLGELIIVPASESFRRQIIAVQEPDGSYYSIELKIPGQMNERTLIRRTHFSIAQRLLRNFNERARVVKPLFFATVTGSLPLYGQIRLFTTEPERALHIAAFEYEDGHRLHELMKHAGVAKRGVDHPAESAADALAFAVQLHLLGYELNTERGNDLHTENFRVLADGKMVSVGDFGAFEHPRKLTLKARTDDIEFLLESDARSKVPGLAGLYPALKSPDRLSASFVDMFLEKIGSASAAKLRDDWEDFALQDLGMSEKARDKHLERRSDGARLALRRGDDNNVVALLRADHSSEQGPSADGPRRGARLADLTLLHYLVTAAMIALVGVMWAIVYNVYVIRRLKAEKARLEAEMAETQERANTAAREQASFDFLAEDIASDSGVSLETMIHALRLARKFDEGRPSSATLVSEVVPAEMSETVERLYAKLARWPGFQGRALLQKQALNRAYQLRVKTLLEQLSNDERLVLANVIKNRMNADLPRENFEAMANSAALFDLLAQPFERIEADIAFFSAEGESRRTAIQPVIASLSDAIRHWKGASGARLAADKPADKYPAYLEAALIQEAEQLGFTGASAAEVVQKALNKMSGADAPVAFTNDGGPQAALQAAFLKNLFEKIVRDKVSSGAPKVITIVEFGLGIVPAESMELVRFMRQAIRNADPRSIEGASPEWKIQIFGFDIKGHNVDSAREALTQPRRESGADVRFYGAPVNFLNRLSMASAKASVLAESGQDDLTPDLIFQRNATYTNQRDWQGLLDLVTSDKSAVSPWMLEDLLASRNILATFAKPGSFYVLEPRPEFGLTPGELRRDIHSANDSAVFNFPGTTLFTPLDLGELPAEFEGKKFRADDIGMRSGGVMRVTTVPAPVQEHEISALFRALIFSIHGMAAPPAAGARLAGDRASVLEGADTLMEKKLKSKSDWEAIIRLLVAKLPPGTEATYRNLAELTNGRLSDTDIQRAVYYQKISPAALGLKVRAKQPQWNKEKWVAYLKMLIAKLPRTRIASVENIVAFAKDRRIATSEKLYKALSHHGITYEEVGIRRQQAVYRTRREWIRYLKKLISLLPEDKEPTVKNIAAASGGQSSEKDIRTAMTHHRITAAEAGIVVMRQAPDRSRDEWVGVLRQLSHQIPADEEKTVKNAARYSNGEWPAERIYDAMTNHGIGYAEAGLTFADPSVPMKMRAPRRPGPEAKEELLRISQDLPAGVKPTIPAIAAYSNGRWTAQQIKTTMDKYSLSFEDIGAVHSRTALHLRAGAIKRHLRTPRLELGTPEAMMYLAKTMARVWDERRLSIDDAEKLIIRNIRGVGNRRIAFDLLTNIDFDYRAHLDEARRGARLAGDLDSLLKKKKKSAADWIHIIELLAQRVRPGLAPTIRRLAAASRGRLSYLKLRSAVFKHELRGRANVVIESRRPQRTRAQWLDEIRALGSRAQSSPELKPTLSEIAAVSEGRYSARDIEAAMHYHTISFEEAGIIKATTRRSQSTRQKWVVLFRYYATKKLSKDQAPTPANVGRTAARPMTGREVSILLHRYRISYEEVGMVRERARSQSRDQWIDYLKSLAAKIPAGMAKTPKNAALMSKDRSTAERIRAILSNQAIDRAEVGLEYEGGEHPSGARLAEPSIRPESTILVASTSVKPEAVRKVEMTRNASAQDLEAIRQIRQAHPDLNFSFRYFMPNVSRSWYDWEILEVSDLEEYMTLQFRIRGSVDQRLLTNIAQSIEDRLLKPFDPVRMPELSTRDAVPQLRARSRWTPRSERSAYTDFEEAKADMIAGRSLLVRPVPLDIQMQFLKLLVDMPALKGKPMGLLTVHDLRGRQVPALNNRTLRWLLTLYGGQRSNESLGAALKALKKAHGIKDLLPDDGRPAAFRPQQEPYASFAEAQSELAKGRDHIRWSRTTGEMDLRFLRGLSRTPGTLRTGAIWRHYPGLLNKYRLKYKTSTLDEARVKMFRELLKDPNFGKNETLRAQHATLVAERRRHLIQEMDRRQKNGRPKPTVAEMGEWLRARGKQFKDISNDLIRIALGEHPYLARNNESTLERREILMDELDRRAKRGIRSVSIHEIRKWLINRHPKYQGTSYDVIRQDVRKHPIIVAGARLAEDQASPPYGSADLDEWAEEAGLQIMTEVLDRRDPVAGGIFGRKIKAVREALGISQREFARRLGVSNVAVIRWEQGRRFMQPELFPKLSAVTRVPVSVWLTGLDERELMDLPIDDSGPAARILFGRKLWVMRLKKGLDLRSLSDEIGILDQSLSEWETGVAYPQDMVTLDNIAGFFSVNRDRLLRSEQKKILDQAKALYGSGLRIKSANTVWVKALAQQMKMTPSALGRKLERRHLSREALNILMGKKTGARLAIRARMPGQAGGSKKEMGPFILKVRSEGRIDFQGQKIYVGQSMIGERVFVYPYSDGGGRVLSEAGRVVAVYEPGASSDRALPDMSGVLVQGLEQIDADGIENAYADALHVAMIDDAKRHPALPKLEEFIDSLRVTGVTYDAVVSRMETHNRKRNREKIEFFDLPLKHGRLKRRTHLALAYLLLQAEDTDWQAHDEFLPTLPETVLGTTNKTGRIPVFLRKDYPPYLWPVLGFGEAGWKVTLKSGKVVNGRYELKVILSKPRRGRFARTFQIGKAGIVLKGIKSEVGHFLRVRSIESRMAVIELSDLLTRPADFAWEGYGGEIKQLIGASFGRVDSRGRVSLRLAHELVLPLQIGTLELKGSLATIDDAWVANGLPQVRIKFKQKDTTPVYRIFQIGPERKTLQSGTRRIDYWQISEDPGIEKLASFLRPAEDPDAALDAEKLKALDGLSLGETDATGKVHIKMAEFYQYPFFVFGQTQRGDKSGFRVIIEKARVVGGGAELTMHLSKKGHTGIRRIFKIGKKRKALPGSHGKEGTYSALELQYASALSAMPSLLRVSENSKWAERITELTALRGMRTGLTNRQGQVSFSPMPYYQDYRWSILGFNEEGWDGLVTDSGIRDEKPYIEVHLSKDDKTIKRVFTIGPEQRVHRYIGPETGVPVAHPDIIMWRLIPAGARLAEADDAKFERLGFERRADDASLIRARDGYEAPTLTYTLVAVPHGKTPSNAELLFQGNIDDVENWLTEEGKDAARKGAEDFWQRYGAELLKDPSRFVFVRSPLKRTQQTFEIYAEYLKTKGVTIEAVVDPMTIEIDHTRWHNHSAETLPDGEKEKGLAYRRGDFFVKPEGGESRLDLMVRAREWLLAQNEQYAGKTIVQFGHGTFQNAEETLLRTYGDLAPKEVFSRTNNPRLRRGFAHVLYAPKITPEHVKDMKSRGEKITMLTAYDEADARLLDEAGIELALVGDSYGMVRLGYPDTTRVTMEDMTGAIAQVKKGNRRALVIGDMPFEPKYAATPEEAVKNARLLVAAGADAVKLEGGVEKADILRAIVNAGIPVMGHIGYTPQTDQSHIIKGHNEAAAQKLMADARAVESAGAFAMVIELTDRSVASYISGSVSIPTIGIGAGPGTDGQVLVIDDLLGRIDYSSKAIYPKGRPRFIGEWDNSGSPVDTVRAYRKKVKAGEFPGEAQSYKRYSGNALGARLASNGDTLDDIMRDLMDPNKLPPVVPVETNRALTTEISVSGLTTEKLELAAGAAPGGFVTLVYGTMDELKRLLTDAALMRILGEMPAQFGAQPVLMPDAADINADAFVREIKPALTQTGILVTPFARIDESGARLAESVPYRLRLTKTSPDEWRVELPDSVHGPESHTVVMSDREPRHAEMPGALVEIDGFMDGEYAGSYRFSPLRREIEAIRVAPQFRGKGVADVLLLDLVDRFFDGDRTQRIRATIGRASTRARTGIFEGSVDDLRTDLGLLSVPEISRSGGARLADPTGSVGRPSIVKPALEKNKQALLKARPNVRQAVPYLAADGVDYPALRAYLDAHPEAHGEYGIQDIGPGRPRKEEGGRLAGADVRGFMENIGNALTPKAIAGTKLALYDRQSDAASVYSMTIDGNILTAQAVGAEPIVIDLKASREKIRAGAEKPVSIVIADKETVISQSDYKILYDSAASQAMAALGRVAQDRTKPAVGVFNLELINNHSFAAYLDLVLAGMEAKHRKDPNAFYTFAGPQNLIDQVSAALRETPRDGIFVDTPAELMDAASFKLSTPEDNAGQSLPMQKLEEGDMALVGVLLELLIVTARMDLTNISDDYANAYSTLAGQRTDAATLQEITRPNGNIALRTLHSLKRLTKVPISQLLRIIRLTKQLISQSA